MQNKIIIPGKVDRLNHRKFRIRKDEASEVDATIEILNGSVDNGSYEVEKLSVDGLPAKMEDGTPIRWLNNFAIKKNGQYINQRYTVTIAGLSSSTSKVVIIDGKGNLYYYPGVVVNDTIELTDGDPGTGQSP